MNIALTSPIDKLLNNITMYRLLLYYLIGLLAVAFILSFFHLLAFTPLQLLLSTGFFLAACLVANIVFAYIFKAQTNFESVYISALILALIVSPPIISTHSYLPLCWFAGWTIASKYIFTLNRKHIFNPVAFGVWFVGVVLNAYATWWVGTGVMLPFVIVGGYLVVRKIKREDMVFIFLAVALVTCLFFSFQAGNDIFLTIKKIILDTPLFFLAFVMLTEPLTTPPTKRLQMYYGGLVGLLFAPQVHVLTYFTTPELALLVGNLYSYIVSPKVKLFLRLDKKVKVSDTIYDFIFTPQKKFAYLPGQYMEWTLGHKHTDSRGNRRYFTLASSPTENTIRLGVRSFPKMSSFKTNLMDLSSREIIASQIAGDFTLPKDPKQKLVFMAGGIGITPYRSMIKYLLDKNERRSITLFYSAKSEADFAYTEIFNEAEKKLGIKTIYFVTDKNLASNWKGYTGRVTPEIIAKEVPDFRERLFYLSGPRPMVDGFKVLLKNLNVPSNHIKEDYFPGLV